MARDISFATFNLYNLQLPGKPWRGNEYTDQEYSDKVAWSAEILRQLDADVIAFQELWSKECLEQVFQRADLYNDYSLIFIRDEWYDIAVAAAVRKPWTVTRKQNHKTFPTGFRLIKRGGAADPEDDEIEVVAPMAGG